MLAADTSLPLLLIVASLDVTASDSPKTREDKRLSVLMCSAQVEAPTEQCEQIDCAPADQHDERNQNGDRHCGLDQVPTFPGRVDVGRCHQRTRYQPADVPCQLIAGARNVKAKLITMSATTQRTSRWSRLATMNVAPKDRTPPPMPPPSPY